MRTLTIAFTAIAMMATPALAAPCKDAKGKFIKCPPAAAVAAKPAMAAKPMAAAKPATKTAKVTTGKKAPCRDAKGRFAKCA